MAKTHLALYGNVAIPRRYCNPCRQWTLIIAGARACCGYSTKEDQASSKLRRMTSANPQRKKPTAKECALILLRQENCCLYCQQRFGSYFRRGEKIVRLLLNYDHLEPHAFAYNNDVRNFVAACHVCNGWKSSKMFSSVEAIRRFVVQRWEERIWQKYGRNLEADARRAVLATQKVEPISASVPLLAVPASGYLNIPE